MFNLHRKGARQMSLIICITLLWLISPIPLSIWVIREKKKGKKRDILLRHLWEQERITELELKAAGLKPPAPLQENVPAVQMQQEQVQQIPVQEHVQQPENDLSAAAERAKLIAESELNGTPLPPVSLAKPAAEPEASAPAAETVPVPQTVPAPAQQVFRPAETTSAFRFSPISILLSVGVVLIIVAGLIFVRSQWGTMADGSKLLTLAAGSVLFFGSAAIALRTLKLERTGTAFYTLGAVFLPISIWTAGFFKLLGSGITGASDAKLYALSFGAFAVCSCIAVKCFRQKSWGIATLCGVTAAVWSAAAAIAQHVPVNVSESDRTLRFAGALAAAAGYAVFLSFAVRPLKKYLPDEINAFSEPFAIAIACTTAIVMPVLEFVRGRETVCMLVVFLMLAAFCSGMMTDRLKELNALPMSLLAAYAFRFILAPLSWNAELHRGMHTETIFALICMICAAVWFLTLLFRVVPDNLKTGAVTAAYTSSGIAVSALFYTLALNHMRSVVPAAVAVILIVITGIYAGKEVKSPVRWLLAAEVFAVCTCVEANLVYKHEAVFGADMKIGFAEGYALLILCGMLLLCFAGFVLTKRWRSGVSDLLFPAACVITAFLAEDSPEYSRPINFFSVAFAIAGAVIFWLLTMEKGEQKPIRFLYAALMPASAAFAALLADEGFCEYESQREMLVTFWGVVMLAAGIFTCCIAKKDFSAPRRLLTALCLIPPAVAAALDGESLTALSIVCVIAAWIMWQLLEKRGMFKSASAAFGTGLFLAAETTVVSLAVHMYERAMNFTEFMVASLWILAAALVSLAENKYTFTFPGCKSLCAVGRFAAPSAALFLSLVLLLFFNESGSGFCYIYTYGFAVVSWLTVKPKQIVMPCFSVAAFFFTMESMRQGAETKDHVVMLLFIMCGLEVLLPYLGKVLREGDINSEQRRSWSLTVGGLIVPLWLLAVSLSGDYHAENIRRMLFFVPILTAGFILHFIPEAQTAEKQKGLNDPADPAVIAVSV